MRLTNESTPGLVDQAVPVVPGGAASLHDLERRLAPSFEPAAPRQRARASLRGVRSPAARQHRWQVAAMRGDATPDGVQHRRRRALWAPEAVREERGPAVVPHGGDPDAVLVSAATGVLNNGPPSAGVARPSRGTAGRIDPAQSGVLWADARRRGPTRLARELYGPQAWTDDRARGRPAGLPDDRGVATTPPRARPRRAPAFAAGVPATWVTGDRVYGDDRRLRRWLDSRPQAAVLAVSGQADVGLGGQPRPVTHRLAALPADGGTRLRAGDGAQGPRWDDGRWLPLAAPRAPAWRRWLLGRRRAGPRPR